MSFHEFVAVAIHGSFYADLGHSRRGEEHSFDFPRLDGMPASANGGSPSAHQAKAVLRRAFKQIAHGPPAPRRELGGLVTVCSQISGRRMLQADPKLTRFLPRALYQLAVNSRHRLAGNVTCHRAEAGKNGAGFRTTIVSRKAHAPAQ